LHKNWHIINATVEITRPKHVDDQFTYLQLPLVDSESKYDQLTEAIKSSFTFIETMTNAKSDAKVLVHCARGQSRSASLVIAFLILKNSWDYANAFGHVKACRDTVRPNASFVRELQKLSKSSIILETKQM